MSAELNARRAVAEAVMADFQRAAVERQPDYHLWCLRLARTLGDLLAWLEIEDIAPAAPSEHSSMTDD